MKIVTLGSRMLSPLLAKKHLCVDYGRNKGVNISIQLCSTSCGGRV